MFWMFQVEDPLSMLSKIMSREGSSIEPRLVQSAGCNTLEAVYRIALYDENKIYLAAGSFFSFLLKFIKYILFILPFAKT